MRERFRREAEAVARLRHPNIVQVHEVGEARALSFFSLEFVEGGSLAQKLASQPQPPQWAAELTETLTRAVHAAHQAGVVHRDLKPANVLLTADGTPKLTDFGLAKQLGEDAGRTHSGAILGTPSYMSPEQAAGAAREVGPAADIYALGAILYDLLTGRPPFRGTTILDTLEQVRNQESVPPSRLQPKVPRDLETICLKCLEKAPARRYATAADLADDLRRFRVGEPIRARRIGYLLRAVKFARRRPAVAALYTVIVLAVVGIVSVWWQYSERWLNERNNAQRERGEAVEARNNYQRQFYPTVMTMAADAWDRGDVATVRNLLDSLRPGDGQPDLRGLEWYYFWDLTHLERLKLPAQAGAVHVVAYSPDGGLLFLGGEAKTTARTSGYARLWDAVRDREAADLPGHPAPVRAAAFSRDSTWLATAGDDGVLRIWDVAARKLVMELAGHTGAVHAVAFAADGDALASGGADKTCRLWHLEANGRARSGAVLQGHKDIVVSVAFAPDGKTLLAGGKDSVLKHWDLASGKGLPDIVLVKGAAAGRVMPVSLAFSPAGKILAVAVSTVVYLLDTAGYTERAMLTGQNLLCRGVAFSLDGKSLASAHGTELGPGDIFLWDGAGARRRKVLKGHERGVLSVSFSPDGKSLASGGYDATVRLWDTGRAAGPLQQQTLREERKAAVEKLQFAPDGQSLVTGGQDGTVRVWNLAGHKEFARTQAHAGPVTALAVCRGGQLIASARADRTVRLWDRAAGKESFLLRSSTDPVTALTFGSDGRRLASAASGAVTVWDTATGRQTIALPWRRPSTALLAFSPDGRSLAAVATAADHTLHLWDLTTGQERFVGVGPEQAQALTFGPEGKHVSVASVRLVRTWEATHGREVRSLDIGSDHQGIRVVHFSPDGTSLVLGGSYGIDGTLWVAGLDGPGAKAAYRFSTKLFRGPTRALAFSPDGGTLAVGDSEGMVRLWDARQWQVRSVLPGHAGEALALVYSPDGNTPAAGLGDGTIRLFSPATGQERGRLKGHVEAVSTVVFSPDGSTLASGSYDRTVRLWDLTSGRERRRLTDFRYSVRCLAFSPDGKTLAASEGRVDLPGEVKLWDVDSGEQRGVLQGFRWAVRAIAYSPDGTALATVSGDEFSPVPGEVLMWNSEASRLSWRSQGHFGSVRSAAFTRDGLSLATGAADQTVKLWDGPTGEERAVLKHTSIVRSVALSPDGTTLLAACDNGLYLWDIPTRRLRGQLALYDNWLTALALSPDGTVLALSSRGGGLSLWRTSLSEADTGAAPDLGDRELVFAPLANPDYQLALCRRRAAQSLRNMLHSDAAEQLCRQAIELLEQQTANHPDIARYREELARTHQARSSALQQAGRLTEAERACTRSLAIWDRLAQDVPTRDYRLEIATVLGDLIKLLQEEGRTEEMQPVARRGLDLYAHLMEEHPGELQYEKLFHTQLHLTRSLIRAERGQSADALAGARNQVALWLELSKASPTVVVHRLHLANSLFNLAHQLKGAEQNQEAEQSFRQCVDVYGQLAAGSTDVSNYQVLQARSLMTRALCLQALGRHGEAEQSLRQIITQLVSVVANSPTREATTGLRTSQNVLAELLEQQGHYREAEEVSHEGVATWKTILAQHPGSPECLLQRGEAESSLGYFLLRRGQSQDGEETLRKSLAVFQQVADSSPSVGEYQRYLASACRSLAQFLHGKPECAMEAERLFRQALDIRERLVVDFPHSQTDRLELARSLHQFGQRIAGRDHHAAERVLRRGIGLFEQVIAERGGHIFETNLADACAELARLLQQTGRIREAGLQLDRTVAIYEKLHAAAPDPRSYSYNLAVYLHDRARQRMAGGRSTEAAQDCHKAIELRRRLVEQFPQGSAHRENLVDSYLLVVQLIRNGEHPQKAEQPFRQAIDLLEQLAADSPRIAGHRNTLASTYGTFGLLLAKANRLEEAETAYRRGLEVRRKLAEQYPTSDFYQSDLGALLNNLGMVLRDRGQLTEARAMLTEAIDHQRAALEINPRNTTYRQYLRNHYGNLAETLLRLGDHAAATTAAAEISVILPNNGPALLLAAELLARCVPLAQKNGRLPEAKRKELAEQYGAQAVGLIGKAVRLRGGITESMLKDRAFDLLRSRQDFQKIQTDLQDRKPDGRKGGS